MTATTTLIRATDRSDAGLRVWRAGATASLTAGVTTVTVAAIARALGVPLRIAGNAIPLAGFAQLTFVAVIVGTILAFALYRGADRPRHTFVTTTIALTLLSIVPDVVVDAHVATKLTLALTHIAAAVIAIPALASRLTD
jgi:hypothetical protein